MGTAHADGSTRTRLATRISAIAGALAIAIAGIAAPWYVRADLVIPVAVALLIVAALIFAAL